MEHSFCGGLAGFWDEACHLMDVAAWHAKSVVMLADRVLVWRLKEAVHIAVGVVVELDLPHPVLVRDALLCGDGYLLESLPRELKVFVKVHEPGHCSSSCQMSMCDGCRDAGQEMAALLAAGIACEAGRPVGVRLSGEVLAPGRGDS
jgi:hypothetical protein